MSKPGIPNAADCLIGQKLVSQNHMYLSYCCSNLITSLTEGTCIPLLLEQERNVWNEKGYSHQILQ